MNRLFEIVYILLAKKTITAKALAEHFEVSIRTIYRDVDTLAAAGMPIYASKGKGGGIRIIDDFVLNKSLVSEQEQKEILMSLQSMNAVKVFDVEPVLNKLSVFFKKQGINWIDVDFSRWGSDDSERKKFNLLKTGILNSVLVSFDYFSSYGEKTIRTVEPIKLVFKGQSWYLYGFCRAKNDFRIFKITRIKNLCCLEETFKREIVQDIWKNHEEYSHRMITLVLKIEAKMAYRLYDEFDDTCIEKNEDGSFTVTTDFPEDEWVYGYILSYGKYAEVLAPAHLRESIRKKFAEGLHKYL